MFVSVLKFQLSVEGRGGVLVAIIDLRGVDDHRVPVADDVDVEVVADRGGAGRGDEAFLAAEAGARTARAGGRGGPGAGESPAATHDSVHDRQIVGRVAYAARSGQILAGRSHPDAASIGGGIVHPLCRHGGVLAGREVRGQRGLRGNYERSGGKGPAIGRTRHGDMAQMSRGLWSNQRANSLRELTSSSVPM